jgi:ribosomal 50S subunit-recycling heat shock protein
LRLDKFLKVSRLIKRRTLAKQICDAGRISVNERTAKASTDVKIGDVLTIGYGQKITNVRIAKIVENPRKEEAISLYEVLSEILRKEIDVQFMDDEDGKDA